MHCAPTNGALDQDLHKFYRLWKALLNGGQAVLKTVVRLINVGVRFLRLPSPPEAEK